MPKGTKPELWDEGQKEFLRRAVKTMTVAEAAEALNAKFGTARSAHGVGSAMKRFGIGTGRCCRFVKGVVPHNKGKTWDEMGISPEARARMRAGQFQPGNLPHSAVGKPIGYERMNRDGYIEVKVKDGRQAEANENFRPKHHLVWEEANGRPVPEGCNIMFADRDKRNLDPGNLVCVPRRLVSTIAKQGTPYHDRESLEAAMLIAEISQKTLDLQLTERDCPECGKRFRPSYPRQRRCRACIEKRKGRRNS